MPSEHLPGVRVAHNHPSGDPAPSPEDVAVTRTLVEAGRLLDIEVLDHLVIGSAGFVSLRERSLGFEARR
jgi:DNA repair protein RadC